MLKKKKKSISQMRDTTLKSWREEPPSYNQVCAHKWKTFLWAISHANPHQQDKSVLAAVWCSISSCCGRISTKRTKSIHLSSIQTQFLYFDTQLLKLSRHLYLDRIVCNQLSKSLCYFFSWEQKFHVKHSLAIKC